MKLKTGKRKGKMEEQTIEGRNPMGASKEWHGGVNRDLVLFLVSEDGMRMLSILSSFYNP